MVLNLDAPGACDISRGEALLEALTGASGEAAQ